MSTPTNVIEQLQRDEGLRLSVYTDTVGKRTIGYGHNLDANPLPFDVSQGITAEQALQILENDVARIYGCLCIKLPWVSSLGDVRCAVMTNMAFNLGVPGLLNFHHDLADTQAGNYLQASEDMKESAWYNQVGARAQRLCQMMATGVWV